MPGSNYAPVMRRCASCNKVVLTGKKRRLARSKLYCSHACASRGREATRWPRPSHMQRWVMISPAVRIAEFLGVSDVAVKKFCKKHGIRWPKCGHWVRIYGIHPAPPIHAHPGDTSPFKRDTHEKAPA